MQGPTWFRKSGGASFQENIFVLRVLSSGAVEGLKIRGADLSWNMRDVKEFPHFYYVIYRKLGRQPPPAAPSAPPPPKLHSKSWNSGGAMAALAPTPSRSVLHRYICKIWKAYLHFLSYSWNNTSKKPKQNKNYQWNFINVVSKTHSAKFMYLSSAHTHTHQWQN